MSVDAAAAVPLRDEQRASTRARIVRAVADLVADEHPAAISVPAVARRAGVGVATVYRYFPTKEALLDAAASEVVSPAAARIPTTFEEIGAALRTTWAELAGRMPLVRNQFASPVGRELHRRRWEARHDAMRTAARTKGIDPDSAIAQRAFGIVDVLTSSTALLELHDKAGIPVDDAADWSAWAVGLVLRATLDEGESP
jgi:AcrR family transcriptional regulator